MHRNCYFFLNPSRFQAYFTSPDRMVGLLWKALLATNLFGGSFVHLNLETHHTTWFFLAFFSLSLYTCLYARTLESVPGRWIVYAGLGVFGLSWTTGRIYSILLAQFLPHWSERFYFNAAVIVCSRLLADAVPGKGLNSGASDRRRETLADLYRNSLGRRYFACLVLLWLIHGYVFYGISHFNYKFPIPDQVLKQKTHHFFLFYLLGVPSNASKDFLSLATSSPPFVGLRVRD